MNGFLVAQAIFVFLCICLCILVAVFVFVFMMRILEGIEAVERIAEKLCDEDEYEEEYEDEEECECGNAENCCAKENAEEQQKCCDAADCDEKKE